MLARVAVRGSDRIGRMVDRVSAGILLHRTRGGRREVLLAHPGGPFHAMKDLGAWSIPKGEIEPGEDLLEVARREFLEETGHASPPDEAFPLGTVRQRGGKLVHAWALSGDLDPATAHSNTFSIEWPPGSGRQEAFPEIDRVAWFGLDEARLRLKDAQVEFLDRLVDALGQ